MEGEGGEMTVGEDLTFGIWAVTGVAACVGGNLCSWSAKRQSVTSVSTAEAELNGQVAALAPTLGISQILTDL